MELVSHIEIEEEIKSMSLEQLSMSYFSLYLFFSFDEVLKENRTLIFY